MTKDLTKGISQALEPINTKMYHSNRITESIMPKMSILELQIFVEIMAGLQKYIAELKEGRQLNIFENRDLLPIVIPFKNVTVRKQYNEVQGALENMRKISVKMPSKLDKRYNKFTGLITSYEIPKNNKMGVTRNFLVMLDKDLAYNLMNIDRGVKGPIMFTKWTYELAKGIKNGYTLRLYWLLCSWKKKGYFEIDYQTFRDILSVPDDMYQHFGMFRKRIIENANNELIKLSSDCWLDIQDKDSYTIKDGTKVVGFRFVVLSQQFLDEQKSNREMKLQAIKDAAERHFDFKKNDVNSLIDLITERDIPLDLVLNKFLGLYDYIQGPKKKPIKNKAAFVLKSLQNEFSAD